MRKLVKVAAAIVYALLLFYIVFFARRRESMKDHRRRELINVVPVVQQVKTYRELAPHDQRGERNFIINLAGNILLFLPLPVLLYSFRVRDKKKLVLIALVTTSGIEAIQLFFHIGVPDIDDILLNMTGAFAGILFLKYLPPPVRTALVRQ